MKSERLNKLPKIAQPAKPPLKSGGESSIVNSGKKKKKITRILIKDVLRTFKKR